VAPLNNDRLLEGLYALGVDINILRGIDKSLPPADFRRQLEMKGVPTTDFDKAQKLVEYRAGDKPTRTALYNMLDIMGASQATIKAVQYAGDNKDKLLATLTKELGAERAGALMIKAVGPNSVPKGTVWNPYRGDKPSDNADVRYGAMGVLTGFNSGPDLPTPPTPVQQKQQAAAAAKTQTPAQTQKQTPAGTGTGTGTGTGAGNQNKPDPVKLPKTPEEVRLYIEENYSQWAYLKDVPEVWKIVEEAAKGGLSDDRILGKLHQTDWWQKTDADARVWKEEKFQDPATAKEKIRVKTDALRRAATAAGITIPEPELAALAEDSLRFKWEPAEEKSALGRFFKYDKDRLMGTALATQQTLQQKGRDWLVPMDDSTLQDWTTRVVTGEVDEAYFDGYLKQQAQSLFPQLADPISRGIPPGQWMAPYKSVAAQTLGLNPDQIDLRESKWMRSINQVDEKGARTAMNLADWEDLLKTDETYGWDKTDQGREHGAQMARKLAGMFRGNA